MITISVRDRQVVVDGQPIRPSPQFFQLYCLLAYARAGGRTGYLTARAIHRLPRWSRARLDSVGKSIHRHAAAMRRAGLDLIESPARGATKLFRMRAAAEEVAFDVSLPEVRRSLGLDLVTPEHSQEAVERAFHFSWATVRARLEMETGNFRGARAALEEAGRVPSPQPKDQVEVLLLWSNLLEHEGRPQEALQKAEQALAVSTHQAVDYLTQARAHIRLGFLGTMLRQPERYPQARAHYLEAHGLLEGSRHFVELSQIATGLGHLARRGNDLESALSYFLAALEYAAAEAWAFGIQAGLFNLGLVQAERGDAMRGTAVGRSAYQQAQLWLERAIEFTNSTGVGRYSSEALGVLSHVLLQLGKGAAAVRWARAALERARSTGNKKSEAVAHEALGRALRGVGMNDEAHGALEASCAIYRELGFEPDAERAAGLAAAARSKAG